MSIEAELRDALRAEERPAAPAGGWTSVVQRASKQRVRQRVRIAIVAVASAAALVAVTAGVLSARRPAPRTRVAASPPASAAGARCRAGDLRLDVGTISEPTQQDSLALTLTNVARRACVLDGYPTIRLLDAAGRDISVVYVHAGDQVVTSKPPHAFTLGPGKAAYVMINKTHCQDGPQVSIAATVSVGIGNETVRAAIGSVRNMAGCAPSDPGRTVTVSPFEPTYLQTTSL